MTGFGEVYFFLAGDNHPYVGRTVYERGGRPFSGPKRLAEHVNEANRCAKVPCFKCASIRKYGVTHFEILEADIETHEELNSAETRWILEKNSFHGDNPLGLNMDRGGQGTFGYRHPEAVRQLIGDSRRGYHHSKETKEKIGSAQRGEKHYNFGQTLSEPHKQRIREANVGKKRSPEACENLRNAKLGPKNPMYGKTGEDHPNFGKTLNRTSEGRAAMSLAGATASHNRWHRDRDIVKEGCTLCCPTEEETNAGS